MATETVATNGAGEAVQHGAGHVALTLADQLPMLLILVPFCAAPLVVLIGSRRFAWPLAYGAATASFVMSVLLLMRVIGGEVISYHIGGWVPPLGIEYRVDAANAFVLFLLTGIATVVLPYARVSVRAEIGERHLTLFYACFLLCLTGLMGVVITGDAFNVFVFLEVSSLSTYVLIAAGAERDRRALTAAYDYLIMGTIGATFFVIGIGMLYMVTGTLNMADIADRIADQTGNRTVRAAFAFIVVGMGLKAAIYPLHLWLPNAYTYAPSAVTAFLAATATKVAIYVLMRFMFSVFQPDYLFEVRTLEVIVIPAGVAGDVRGLGHCDIPDRPETASGLFQPGADRLHAFGYRALERGRAGGGGGASLQSRYHQGGAFHGRGRAGAALWQLVHRPDCRGGAGDALDQCRDGDRGLEPDRGAGHRGFVSKWVLVQATLEAGWWPVAMLIVLSSLLAVIYVWKMVEALYLTEPVAGVTAHEAPRAMLVPMWIMALACVWFGLNTDVTMTASVSAAQGFMTGSAGMAEVQGVIGQAVEAATAAAEAVRRRWGIDGNLARDNAFDADPRRRHGGQPGAA